MCLWFKRIKTVDDLVEKCKDYKSVARWIRWNINKAKPLYGSFPTSQDVLKKRKAFCKGFAVLSYDALEKLGHNPSLVSFMWRTDNYELVSHVICVFKHEKVFHYLDNGVLHVCSIAQSTLEDVVRFACPKTVYSAYQRDGKGKLLKTLVSGV